MHVVRDSKEKVGWFDFSVYPGCSQSTAHLRVGDYVLEGKNAIVIDRKRSVEELAKNLGIKYGQLARVCQKMQTYGERYFVCEFTFDEMLAGSKWSNITGQAMGQKINELEREFGVRFVFCRGHVAAELEALSLLRAADQGAGRSMGQNEGLLHAAPRRSSVALPSALECRIDV